MIGLLVSLVPASTSPEASIDFTWLFIKMLLVLTIVIVMALMILKYGLPRITGIQRFQQGRLFTLMARQAIEPRKSLALVRLGTRYFVLGIADHGITPITELSEVEARELVKT